MWDGLTDINRRESFKDSIQFELEKWEGEKNYHSIDNETCSFLCTDGINFTGENCSNNWKKFTFF